MHRRGWYVEQAKPAAYVDKHIEDDFCASVGEKPGEGDLQRLLARQMSSVSIKRTVVQVHDVGAERGDKRAG